MTFWATLMSCQGSIKEIVLQKIAIHNNNNNNNNHNNNNNNNHNNNNNINNNNSNSNNNNKTNNNICLWSSISISSAIIQIIRQLETSWNLNIKVYEVHVYINYIEYNISLNG